MAGLNIFGPVFMKRASIVYKIVLWMMFCAGAAAGVELGSKLQNFQLKDAQGASISLESYSGKVVVFVFWSFKCPVSLAYDDRVEKLRSQYRDKGVFVFGVATGANDKADEIRANAANLKIQFPVLLDTEGDLAEKLAATHTPEVFILDRDAVLRYRGAFDNNKKQGESGRIAYAEDAIDAILSGRTAPVSETRPFGCSIKRRPQ
jgi:peroxiredoxin